VGTLVVLRSSDDRLTLHIRTSLATRRAVHVPNQESSLREEVQDKLLGGNASGTHLVGFLQCQYLSMQTTSAQQRASRV
jgi:hypothetical protein